MASTGRFKLKVEGIEATQATQFYRSARHLDPATAQPDNSVPLVAGKEVGLRVYPDLLAPNGKCTGALVDGEVEWRPSGGSARWRRASRLNGAVPGSSAASIDRGDPGQSLNFRIPAGQAKRKLAVRARVRAGLPGSGGIQTGWVRRTLRFEETRPLRLRLYGVHYRRGGLDLPPPSAVEALETLNYARKTFPVCRIEIVSYEVIDFGEDLSDPAGGRCGIGWNKLLLLLHRLRTASLSADLAYALLPRGVPIARVRGGGSTLGVGASIAGEGSSLAQELGHALLRRHAPGGNASRPDPAYPAYDGYPPGSVGEYGFDASTGSVFDPRSSHDFMSYGPNPWVSPYTYSKLLSRFTEASGRSSRPAGDHRARRLLYLGFAVDEEHRIELTSGLILRGQPIETTGPETSFRLELRGSAGGVLASRRIRHPGAGAIPRDGVIRPRSPRGDGERLHFLQSLPFPAGARRLVFRCCRDHPPAEFEIPRRKTLSVELTDPQPWKPGALLAHPRELRWRTVCEAAAAKIHFYLRYTRDGGRSWRPVDLGFAFDRSTVEPARLPGGERCRLQVVASTLLETATAETPPFRVEKKARRAAIAGFPEGQRVERGQCLELSGTAHSPEGFAEENELVWRSDGEGILGKGSRLLLSDLAPGAHRITLTAPDGVGGETQATAMVQVATAGTGAPG